MSILNELVFGKQNTDNLENLNKFMSESIYSKEGQLEIDKILNKLLNKEKKFN